MPAGKMTRVPKGIKTIRKEVRRAINSDIDKKEINTTVSGVGFGTGGALYKLCEVENGSTEVTRNGNKINIKSIDFSGHLDVSGLAAADDFNYMRMILIYSPRHAAAQTDFPQTLIDHVNNSKAFYVLHDKTYYRTNNGYESGPKVYFKVRKRLNGSKGYTVQFDGTSATAGVKGQLYAYFISDSSAIPHPDLTFVSRVNFTDL